MSGPRDYGENPDATYDWTRYYQNARGPTSDNLPYKWQFEDVGLTASPTAIQDVAELSKQFEPQPFDPLWTSAAVDTSDTSDRLYEMGLEDFLSDWDDDQEKLKKRLANAGSGAGTAQSDYNKAMSSLAGNYAIYERLMNASADDTAQDIRDLIDEAAQSEELAALEEASGYGLDYVNRGDIGTGIAGMDINPQGNYVSGDAAALLRLSAAESDLNIEDLQAKQAANADYIGELAELTGMTADMRIGEAEGIRAQEEAARKERLQKALAAAAAARRRAQEDLDDLGSRDEAAAGYLEAYLRDQEREGLLNQSGFNADMDQFYRDLDSPSMNSDPALMQALMDWQSNVETRAVMDELIGEGAINPATFGMSDDQLASWFRANRPS